MRSSASPAGPSPSEVPTHQSKAPLAEAVPRIRRSNPPGGPEASARLMRTAGPSPAVTIPGYDVARRFDIFGEACRVTAVPMHARS